MTDSAQTAVKALKSPLVVRIRSAGLDPNFTTAPLLGRNADALPATTLSVAGSAFAGGTTNRQTG